MIRAFSFLILVYITVVAPVWVVIPCLFLYALRFGGYELIFLCFCIDALYTTTHTVIPYYTITSTMVLFVLEWLRPRLSLYNH